MTVVILVMMGCEPGYSPAICNGYPDPIIVIARSQHGSYSIISYIPVGKCSKGEIVANEPKGMNERARQTEHLFGTLKVLSLDAEILATYSGEATKLILPGLHFTPDWLVTERGLFLIPRDFRETWDKNIPPVEKAAAFSVPR